MKRYINDPTDPKAAKKKKVYVLAESKQHKGDNLVDIDEFITEGNNLKSYYDKKGDADVEVIPFYGKDDLAKVKAMKMNPEDEVFVFGHSGGNIGGIKHEELASTLKDSGVKTCYMGSCNFEKYSEPYKQLENFYYRATDQWLGVNPKSDNIISAMFSKNNDYDKGEVGIMKPQDGVHYSKSFSRSQNSPIEADTTRNINEAPMMRANHPYAKTSLPKYGFGAALSKAGQFLSENQDAVNGVAGTMAAAGQVGNPNGFKGFLSGAGSGMALGSILPGIGTAIGAIGGGIIGLLSGRKKKKEQEALLEAQENERLLAEQRMIQNEKSSKYIHSQGVLNEYPTEGISNSNYYGKYYRYGGNPKKAEYLAEDAEVIEYDPANPPQTHANGEVEPLSPSMGEIKGDSHSDPSGGVAMSGGERIYSDSIKPSELGVEYFKSLGLKSKGTYANIAKYLGRLEGKQELSLDSDNKFESERAKRMKIKLAEAKDILFADQESNKPMNDMEKEMYGKKLPKYLNGALVRNPFLRFRTPNEITDGRALTPEQQFGMTNSTESSKSGFELGNFLNKGAKFLGDNLDMIAPIGQYFANNRDIEQMPLTQKTQMYSPIAMDYTRGDGLQQSRIASTANQALRFGTAGSTQTQNAIIGDVVSRAVNASNDVSDAENKRIEAIKANNVQNYNQAGLYNTDLTNRTYGDYQQNRMLQLSEKMNNRNNLTQSILGNLQVRKMNEADRDMIRLISERDKERGIIDRSETYKNFLKKYGIG